MDKIAPEDSSLGDCNADGTPDLSDAIFSLGYLFVGRKEPDCETSCDTNDDGVHDLSDAIWLLTHLFLGGLPPKAPFDACGRDPTDDELACRAFSPCL